MSANNRSAAKAAWERRRQAAAVVKEQSPRPDFESHPHSVLISDPSVSYIQLRDYCSDDLDLPFRDAAIVRHVLQMIDRDGRRTSIDQGFVVHFRDPVPAVQFKLTWNGLDYGG